MWFFKKKKMVRVELIGYNDGISEGDALTNLATGHMMGGFDGMVHAQMLNDSQGPTATFEVFYDNNTSKIITVDIDSIEYRFYMNYID